MDIFIFTVSYIYKVGEIMNLEDFQYIYILLIF